MKTNRPGGLTLTRAAVEFCGFNGPAPVLDAGCGYGATCRFLAQEKGLTTVGIDHFPDRIFTDKNSDVWAGTLAKLPHLPFKDEVFQGIFCECVLSLVGDKPTCLAEFFRVLKPGGKLVLADLYLPEQGEGHVTTCLDGAVTQVALHQALYKAGFSILLYEDHTRLLKEMACEMIFKHGSLDKFRQTLTPNIYNSGRCDTGLWHRCRTGQLKPGYCMVIAEKQ